MYCTICKENRTPNDVLCFNKDCPDNLNPFNEENYYYTEEHKENKQSVETDYDTAINKPEILVMYE